MKKILMLALAPIRKNKGQTVSLLVFALITAMLLNIGLVLYFGISSFYDERAEANHSAHFSAVYYSGFDSIEQGQRFIENDLRVSEMEKTYAIGGFGEYGINDANALICLIFARADEAQKMDAVSLIGDYMPLTGNRIYIPNSIFLSGGFNLGDDFKVVLFGTELNFTIAGATEELVYGTQMNIAMRFYVSDESYSELENTFSGGKLTLLSVRLDNKNDVLLFQTEHDKAVSSDGLAYTLNYDSVKQSRVMIPTMIAIIITAFAIILLAVSLIVIRFRIVNGIEESMTNIGVQKAMGYRNIQIIAANVMQYGLVALAGGIIGAILAGLVTPVITKIFEPMLALAWNPGFNINTSVSSILLVLLTVVLIAFMTSRKIHKLHPLTALRGGMTTHSFRRNSFSLDKSHGALSLLLALKQIMQNKKQTITVSVIVAAITMAAVAGIAVNYSMNDGREAFGHLIGGELAATDLAVTVKDSSDGQAFKTRMLEYPEIRKVLAFQADGVYMLVDEVKSLIYATEDCSQLEGGLLVSGYYPKHDNEIVLGIAVAKVTGKKEGDTVTIRMSGNEKDYIVTGIMQSTNNSGLDGLLTTAGIRAIMPDFMFSAFFIYLNNGVDINAFTERIQSAEGNILDVITNTQELLAVTFDSMGGMFAAVAYGIIAVTVFVVILTLYMVIKTTILRRRRELGIQKAVGFTTFQLMNQIALNMTPVILLGVAAGAVAGCFVFNPMFSALLSGTGIAKINLPIPLDQIIAVCIALVVLAYAVSMLIAWRIRKISAYSLVSE